MVRFVDLEDEGREDGFHQPVGKELLQWDEDRLDINHSHRLSLALSCYPIVSVFAQYVDITTLHELSRTCRRIRSNLLQHRSLLLERTLRCTNEKSDPASRLGEAFTASLEQWTAFNSNASRINRMPSGKVCACARDMVGECRRCGEAVCRNCVVKAPSIRELKNRHRRLCRTCMKSPLEPHTAVLRPTKLSILGVEEADPEAIAYAREPCTCESDAHRAVWICQTCGQGRSTADTTYLRGWAWRTRYSACGGVGAGLGQGNEGVECGRRGDCLAAKEVEKEIECDADELAALEAEMEKAGLDGRKWAGSSHMIHEIVGVGGKVKKKIKKEVLVGAIVKEYEDEKKEKKFLQREQNGLNRSWCSWCARVVPGNKDTAGASEDFVDTPNSSAPQTPSAQSDSIKLDMWRK